MKDTKAHILQTSFSLFLQKTFKEVTMNEILSASKLSKGAFYHYFTSKEQLFEEVINRFYLEFSKIDYTQFSQDSLKAFMEEYSEGMDKFTGQVIDGGIEKITANYFLPMIDALRMLPDFRDQLLQARQLELNAWMKIIKIARKKGEIKTATGDEQLAKLFIYSGDGAGIIFMLAGRSGSLPAEVRMMWEGIYTAIKA